jgi:hypothetical protein
MMDERYPNENCSVPRAIAGRMSAVPAIVLILGFVSATATVCKAADTVATVDTFGLNHVSRDAVLKAAGIRVGDPVPDADTIRRGVSKLEAVPGIEQASIAVVHVKPEGAKTDGLSQAVVYIGVRETGRPGVSFRAAPVADVVLPAEIVDTYHAFNRALQDSFRRGNFSEDDSHGYCLGGDEAARAAARKFVPLAEQHFDRLVEVLHTAKDAEQRQIAAWVVGYAADKTKAAAELDAAVRDPDQRVRNNAMRALGVILNYAASHPELAIEAPVDSYLDLVEALAWTDRNKAVMVLLGLSARGNETLIARLRARSLPTRALANTRPCHHGVRARGPNRGPRREGNARSLDRRPPRGGHCPGPCERWAAATRGRGALTARV